jgi:two-component system response regulator HydG
MRLGRRSTRVPAWLLVGELVSLTTGEVLARDGYCRNVSLDGMEVEVSIAELHRGQVAVDTKVRLSVFLQEGFAVLTARVARGTEIREGARTAGRMVVRLGLELLEVPAQVKRQLARFLERQRNAVLLVHADAGWRATTEHTLRDDFEVLPLEDGGAALKALRAQLTSGAAAPVLVWGLDLAPAASGGLGELDEALRQSPESVAVVLASGDDLPRAIAALNSGEVDSVLGKTPSADELAVAVVGGLERRRMLNENRNLVQQLFQSNDYLRSELDRQMNVEGIVGAEGGLAAVLEQVRRISGSSATVLVTGESGTGKEVLAHAIHQLSSRRGKPLVRFNCAALSDSLLESELFGHEKGAFTGANERRVGRFELADGGTIFLDEIGDVPLRMQVKLLRVLQEREFERVGGNQTLKVDIRVIAATNQELPRLVEQGRFRADLYYRLNVIHIHVPPLRDRRQDVQALIEHFLRHFASELHRPVAGISEEAMALLCAHDWPGNVRELKNEVERLVALSEPGLPVGPELIGARWGSRVASGRRPGTGGPTVPGGADGVPAAPADGRWPQVVPTVELSEAVEAVERELISRTLRATGGNQVQTARKLGLSREGLRKKLKRYGLSAA